MQLDPKDGKKRKSTSKSSSERKEKKPSPGAAPSDCRDVVPQGQKASAARPSGSDDENDEELCIVSYDE